MTDADAAPCSVGVVVVAAGSGSRLGAGLPKAFVPLRGRPLLAHAVDTVARLPGLAVARRRGASATTPTADRDRLWAGVDLPPGAVVVAGGAERADSVAAGLAAVGAGVDVVLVHDAARCLTPLAVFERVVAAVRRRARRVRCPASRSSTRSRPSTPTGSSRARPTARRCGRCRRLRASGGRCSLAAYAQRRAGDRRRRARRAAAAHHVVVVEGDPLAFKVTTPDDLDHAERVLERRADAATAPLPD